MAKSNVLQRSRDKKQTIAIDVFAGIDRSTSRYRIEGDGQRLYEAANVFPYIQGLVQRRKDSVQTNSRDSNNAFPAFPAGSMTGNAVVKQILEFNSLIVILYEDDGDTGKLLIDSFDVDANTLTNRLAKAAGYTFTAGGAVNAVAFSISTLADPVLGITPKGGTIRQLNAAWVLSVISGELGDGISEVFLQCLIFKIDKSVLFSKIFRFTPNAFSGSVVYFLSDNAAPITKFLTFGYQTSSAGATTVMLVFKASSIWVLTGIGATESFEQVTGNIGLVGTRAVTYTPFGVCFVGRDTDGLLNLYVLDRNSLVLHTIGHELYEELNDIPKANYEDVVVSFHRNRMVRIAITKTGDTVPNNQEYWIDFYNGIKKRTLWGPNSLPASNSLTHAISFSGGTNPDNSGYFTLIKESNTFKIYEEVATDTFNSVDSEWDDQVYRTKMFDFGRYYGIVSCIKIVARANDAKFRVFYEVPKAGGDDNDTTITEINSGFQMANTGKYITKPIRIVPGILANQIGFKIESDYDVTDNKPFEPLQFIVEYKMTGREVIE